MVFQVDSAEKLRDIITGNDVGPRPDTTCVVVHELCTTDQFVLSELEQQLLGFCHKNLDEFAQPVIELPAL
jgi:hypothetical protein